VCGDGVVQPPEACDDGNEMLGDGCSGCVIEAPFTCAGQPSVCTPIPPQVVTVDGIGLGITDAANHYDGSVGTMDCATISLVDQGWKSVQRVSLEVGIDHPYVGDLVLKLVSPQGTVSTMMSRPGLAEPNDTYDESNGYSADVSAAYPVTFDDGESNDAEQLGANVGTVCKDDQRCRFFPDPGAGPGHSLADFKGESPVGSWKVCLADGDDNDAGTLQHVTLSVLAW
jgi:cysteine-rich repeat protein